LNNETKKNSPNNFTLNVFNNYLALSNIYQVEYHGVGPVTTTQLILGKANENSTVGTRFLSDNENTIGGISVLPEIEYSRYLYQQTDQIFKLKLIINRLVELYNYSFLILTMLLPFMTIFFILKKEINLILISASAFLYNLMFAVLQTPIDRYSFPTYTLSMICFTYLYKVLFSFHNSLYTKFYNSHFLKK